MSQISLSVGAVMFWLSALAISLVLALAQITRMDTSRDYRSEFLRLLVTTTEATSAVGEMEIGNRGFLLTGDQKFRRPFYHGRDIFSDRYQELLKVTADEPLQQDRIKSVKAKLTQWFKLYNPLIQKRQREKANDGQMSDQDQDVLLRCSALFDDIRALLGEVRAFEEEKFYTVPVESRVRNRRDPLGLTHRF